MNAIKAVVRDGRIENDDLSTVPDGTEVIVVMNGASQSNGEVDILGDSPESIAAWLKVYDALEPLEFSEEERQAWQTARKEQREWELAHFDERIDKLKKLWE